MNSALALQLGDIVQLQDLSTSFYNHHSATVEGFDDHSQRFVVNLHDRVKRIKIRAKNARVLLYPQSVHEECKRIIKMREDHVAYSLRDICNEGLRVIESLNKCDMSPNEYVHSLSAVSRTCEMFLDRQPQSAIIEKMKASMNLDIDARAKVYLQVEMAHHYLRLRKNQNVFDILKNIRGRPFGKLPEIFVIEAQAVADFQHLKRSYEEIIEPMIVAGNYFYDFKKCKDRCPSILVHQACSAGDLSFAMHMLSKMSPNKEDFFDFFIAKAMILNQMNKPLEALDIFTALQEKICSQRGAMDVGVYDILFQKMQCYAKLYDKSNTFKCLKHMKRMGFHQKITEEWEVKMKKHFRGTRGKAKCASPAITKSKCSNPVCRKIEEGTKQFKTCARCKVAVYCSRKCQKAHYESGHKQVCKELAF